MTALGHESSWMNDELRLFRDSVRQFIEEEFAPHQFRIADLDAGLGSVIGVPIPDLQVYILDPYGRPQPVGIPGEMYVGGAGVARGYLNRLDLSKERFIQDPFAAVAGARLYRSGDLARRLRNGDIEYLGRIDTQVKIRGFRIELGEIEACIARDPAIREVAVRGRDVADSDRRLVAYIVAERDQAGLIDQLRARIRAALPEYMVPSHFVLLPSLPLTSNGKVDGKALAAINIDSDERPVGRTAPRTATEKTLAKIWAEVPHTPAVGIHDNFFEIGGHSLLAARVMAQARAQTNVDVPLRSLFEQPTVEALATAIDALAWAARSAEPDTDAAGNADREEVEI